MSCIYKYNSLEEGVCRKLKENSFRFLTFDEDLGEIEVLTIEDNDKVLAYAILQKAEDLKSNFYKKLVGNLKIDICFEKYNIEALEEELEESDICIEDIEEIKEELQYSKCKLKTLKRALTIYKRKEFYYLSYMEAIPHNRGNGTLLVDYIKNNYKNIVIIASGYEEDEDKPRFFWEKQGFTNTNYSSMLLQ